MSILESGKGGGYLNLLACLVDRFVDSFGCTCRECEDRRDNEGDVFDSLFHGVSGLNEIFVKSIEGNLVEAAY